MRALIPFFVLLGAGTATPAAAQTPANDTCATATPIAGTGTFLWNNQGATTSGFDGGDAVVCAPATGAAPPVRDVFFRWTALASGTRQFRTCEASFDTALNVHAGRDCAATCLLGNDASGCGPTGQSSVTIAVVAGSEYLVQLGEWGLNGSSADQPLEVVSPPPGGVFANVIRTACENPGAPSGSPSFLVAGAPPLWDTDFLFLDLSGGPDTGIGILLVAPTESGPTTVQPFGEGTLCLTGSIGRYSPAMAAAQSNPALDSTGVFVGGNWTHLAGNSPPAADGFSIPLELPFAGPTRTIQPGDSYSFQLVYRDTDANGFPSVNASSMMVVTFP